jgi:hypothetical protein
MGPEAAAYKNRPAMFQMSKWESSGWPRVQNAILGKPNGIQASIWEYKTGGTSSGLLTLSSSHSV